MSDFMPYLIVINSHKEQEDHSSIACFTLHLLKHTQKSSQVESTLPSCVECVLSFYFSLHRKASSLTLFFSYTQQQSYTDQEKHMILISARKKNYCINIS